MNFSFWNKRIPTLLGIIIVALGIIATSYLNTIGVIPFIRANPTATPQNIRTSDVTDFSFIVSYTTETETTGFISYGETKELGNIALDIRDQKNGTPAKHTVHYIAVTNLKPKTNYFFTIASNDTSFFDTNDKPFIITTGQVITEKSISQQPATGKILFPQDESKQEAIVYLTGPQIQTVSAIVKQDGTYVIPLNTIRNVQLSSYVEFKNDIVLNGLVINARDQSTFTMLPSQLTTIPTILFAKQYDFTSSQIPIASSSAQASIAASLRFPILTTQTKEAKMPEIIIPKKDERFVDDQPLFTGTASPGATIKVIIHSPETIEEKITANNKGLWSFRPKTQLSVGEHTITITTPDEFGILRTLTQTFTVYASGSQVDQSATPSATPIFIITPTPTVISSPTPTTTISPTKTPIPTQITPTATPTSIPIPSVIPTNIQTKKQLLEAGNNTSVLGITAVGIITFLSAILIFLFTKGKVRI